MLTKENVLDSFSKLHLTFDLTKRQVEVLAHLINGLSNKEIGEKLFIHEKSVKFHMTRIFKQMAVRNRTEAVIKTNETLGHTYLVTEESAYLNPVGTDSNV